MEIVYQVTDNQGGRYGPIYVSKTKAERYKKELNQYADKDLYFSVEEIYCDNEGDYDC